MTQQSKMPANPVTQSKPVVEDLSQELARTLTKAADETIRTVRVFDNCYRCNWWVQEETGNSAFKLGNGRIRRSRFVRATRSGGQLVIEDVTGQ